MSSTASTPARANHYACVACKKRKIRCDKKDPTCSNCTAAGIDCVPGIRAPYSYRRRKPRQPGAGVTLSSRLGYPGGPPVPVFEAPLFNESLWAGLHEDFPDPRDYEDEDDEEDDDGKTTTSASPLPDPSDLFFGVRPESLRDLHPQPMASLTLWQAYLENVNPLTKLIHAPSVQNLIIEVNKDFDSSSRATTALVFAIYSAAAMSMSEDECLTALGEPRHVLLNRYFRAAQAALSAAGFMKTNNIVVFQAFVVYTLSARHLLDADAAWILTGVAVRMGQKMGMGMRKTEKKFSVFDIEMRRRVWCQLKFIDGRLGRSVGQPLTYDNLFAPPLPSNLNDADLNPDMGIEPKTVPSGATEMIFCLTRYEIGKFLFTSMPKLRSPIVPMKERDQVIDDFEKYMEETYLQYCDDALPLHLLAKYGVRSALAKMTLMVHHPCQYPDKGASMSQEENAMIFASCVKIVEIDVLGQKVDKVAQFAWHLDVYFQFDSFIFLLIASRRQPLGPLVDRAWELVQQTYDHRLNLLKAMSTKVFRALEDLTLRAWEAHEQMLVQNGLELPSPPPIVTALRFKKLNTNLPDTSISTTATEYLTDSMESGYTIDATMDDTMAAAMDDGEFHAVDLGVLDSMADLSIPLPDTQILDEANWDWGYWNSLLENNG